MEIYGLGLIALCMFIGSFIGRVLGIAVGVSGDVGGVGFAMLLLIIITNYFEKKGKPISEKTGKGMLLLSSLYIPIVVAMSAKQDVVSAFQGGVVAFVAGTLATIGGLILVPVISKIGNTKNK